MLLAASRPESRLYLDHEGLPGNLAEVLVAQQLARGQHDAAPRGILPPKAPVQVQRLPCIMPATITGASDSNAAPLNNGYT